MKTASFPWFPRTKLVPPQVGADTLPRPRLIQAMHTAVFQHRLTLLSAPAGSGKTTAVAALHHAFPELPLGWMTLDEDDNDPLTFMALFVATLQSGLPGCGQETAALLTSSTTIHISLRRFMALLINELLDAHSEPLVLVLDDLHRVTETAVYDALNYLLDNLPATLHLVVTTRTDPPLALARLRSRGQLAELRMADLRFNGDEISHYLNRQWQLHLSAANLAALQKQTEGWAASLHLLAGRLHELTNEVERSQFITHFTQSNRLIFDLLADEVLAQQPPQLRQFLLQTSILEALTPELCTAVTQNPDAPQLLDQAYRRNLFLVALEETTSQTTSYRCHALFAAFLQRQMQQTQADLLPELHRRAAAAMPPDRAVQHYLAANSWAEAAALLEQIGRDEIARSYVYQHTVEQILALPPEIQKQRPWLQLVLGMYYALRGRADDSESFLSKARQQFREQGDEAGELETLTMEAARLGGMIAPDVLASLDEKLANAPHLFRPAQLALVHIAHQWTMQSWQHTTTHMQAALEVAQRRWDPGAITIVAAAFGPELLFNDQGMGDSEQFLVQALTRTGVENSVQRRLIEAGLAYIRFYQARLAEAEQLALTVDNFLHQIGGEAWIDGQVVWLRLTLLLIQQDYAAAARLIPNSLERLAQNKINADYIPGVYYLEAHSFWQQGRLDKMREAIEQFAGFPESTALYGRDIRLCLLNGRLALALANYREAETLLQQAVSAHQALRHTMMLHEPRLALALLYHQWGREAEALAVLKPTLLQLRQREMPGVVLQEGASIVPLLQLAVQQGLEQEFVQPLIMILGETAAARPLQIPNSTEALSPREVEVLRLVATGATNQAIAAQLVITERTVKAHVSSILQKLGAATRTEAVSRAREWLLIT